MFEPGVFPKLVDGTDLTLIATGGCVGAAVEAALKMHESGISTRVLNASSIQPVDTDAIVAAAKETKGIMTIEDHAINGGLGGAVAEVTAEKAPIRMLRHGVLEFGESGTPEALYEKHKLDAKGIESVARGFAKTLG